MIRKAVQTIYKLNYNNNNDNNNNIILNEASMLKNITIDDRRGKVIVL